ncbi:MAG: phosphatase PAP2 family protein [Ferruginibacter sp.]
MKKIIAFDKWMFAKINKDWANEFFDAVMPFLRQAQTWFPFYLFLVIFIILNFPAKALRWIVTMGITVGVSDVISSRFFKPVIGRLRPCNDPDVADSIRMLANYCGQNGSFTSSHAANHVAMATFLFITLQRYWGNWCYLFFAWAMLVSYAQVYVGVHFPFDVMGGAFLGFVLAYISANLFNKKTGGL